MTLEITRNGKWIYRINPTDPRLIERRENKHGARWYWYARRDTPNEAKASLLKLGRSEGPEEP